MENINYVNRKGSLLIFKADDGIRVAYGVESIANIAIVPYNQIVENSEITDLIVVLTFKTGGHHSIVSDKCDNEELFNVLISEWEKARRVTEYRCTAGGG